MVTHNVDILVRVINEATGKLELIERKLSHINSAGKQVVQIQERMNNKWKTVREVIKPVQELRNRFMGLGFSLLFAGMQLNRFFMGMINSAINSYHIMGTENSIFATKTNELTAEWEFFKFSLIDALSQSGIFLYIIDLVINLVRWFGQLPDSVKIAIAGFVGFGAVITQLGSMAGSIVLLDVSLKAAFGTGLFVALSSFYGWIVKITTATWAWTISLLSNPITWIIVLVTALIVLLTLLVIKYGGVGNALKAMVSTTIMGLALLADALITMVLTPLQWIAVAILWIMELSDRWLGTNLFRNEEGWRTDTAKSLTSFVEYKPNTAGWTAQKLTDSGMNPEPTMSTSESFAVMKEAIAQGFKSIVPDLENATAAGVERGTRGNINSVNG